MWNKVLVLFGLVMQRQRGVGFSLIRFGRGPAQSGRVSQGSGAVQQSSVSTVPVLYWRLGVVMHRECKAWTSMFWNSEVMLGLIGSWHSEVMPGFAGFCVGEVSFSCIPRRY